MRAVRGDPALNGDLKAFSQARLAEQRLESATAFTYDMSYLLDALNKFGTGTLTSNLFHNQPF